jgi:hypothetical protein
MILNGAEGSIEICKLLENCSYYYRTKIMDDSAIILVLNAITDKHLRWGLRALIVSESSDTCGIINVSGILPITAQSQG